MADLAMVANLQKQLALYEALSVKYGRTDHRILDYADCALAPIIFFVIDGCEKLGAPDPLQELPVLNAWWQSARNDEPVTSKVVTELDEGMEAFARTMS